MQIYFIDSFLSILGLKKGIFSVFLYFSKQNYVVFPLILHKWIWGYPHCTQEVCSWLFNVKASQGLSKKQNVKIWPICAWTFSSSGHDLQISVYSTRGLAVPAFCCWLQYQPSIVDCSTSLLLLVGLGLVVLWGHWQGLYQTTNKPVDTC